MNASILQIALSVCFAPGPHPSEGMLFHPLPDNPYALDGRRACGPMCLAFLDGYLTGRLRYEEAMERCPPGPLGTNLQQVRRAAEQLGYHTAAFQEATVSQLRRLPFPAILHCQDASETGHFVVLLGWNPERVKV